MQIFEKIKLRYAQFLLGIRPLELALIIKKLFPLKRRIVNLRSVKLSADPISAYGIRLIRDKEYESDLLDEMNFLLDKRSVFIDLGANEGFFSIFAAHKIGPEGIVIAIEPQSSMVKIIKENIKHNSLENIHIVKAAVSNTQGKTNIVNYPSINSGASRIGSSWRYKFYTSEQVNLCSLDKIICDFNLDKVDVIKIDIEGFEYNALLSADESLSKKIIKNLFIEIHPHYLTEIGQSEDMLVEFMVSKGYKFKRITDVYHFYP